MRVCFVMPALPHYFKFILNKIVEGTDYEIMMVKPAQKGQATGVVVKETTNITLFRLVELEEYRIWYGKPFFKGLMPVW